MAAYGYDGRHLFCFDEDIRYQGVTGVPPAESRLVGEERMAARFTGSYFLSGRRDPSFNVWADGEATSFVMSFWKDGIIQHGAMSNPGDISYLVPICLNGPIIHQPDMLATFCGAYPSSTVFVCPVDEELAALGALVRDMPPRRVFIAEHNTDELPYESQAYDPKLEDDCYGRMALLVAQGMPAHNDIYAGSGSTPFYGNTLCNAVNPDIDIPVVMVRSQSMNKYFPETPISAKHFAATSMPVTMKTSNEFRRAANTDAELVSVLVASDFIPGSPEFMRFYQLFSGKKWVSIIPSVIPLKTMPLFRYNKSYRVPLKNYMEMGK